jgi:hypothetical protein
MRRCAVLRRHQFSGAALRRVFAPDPPVCVVLCEIGFHELGVCGTMDASHESSTDFQYS